MTQSLSKMHQRVLSTKDERLLADNQRDKDKARKIIEEANVVPVNTWWDDASKAYVEINTTIVEANTELADRITAIKEDPEKRAKIKDEAAVIQTLAIIGKDIETCQSQIDAVYETHKDKKGGATTPDEMVQVMETHAGYESAVTLYHENVIPLAKQLFEELGEDVDTQLAAMSKMAKLADNVENLVIKHDEATDPNVVTDVVIKSESTGQ